MRIYLDNNILIDYEEDPTILPHKNNYEYRCSYIHLEELMESMHNLEGRRKKRFDTIRQLTHNIFMVNSDLDGVLQEINSCERYYEVLRNPFSQMLHQSLTNTSKNWLNSRDPDTIIKYFGINKKDINNFTIEKLLTRHRDFIEYYVRSTDDGNRMASFQSFFNVLDLLGFWRDKINEGALLNRIYDAQHAYFATGCDYFVSNDRRTCMKSNVLYNYYGYKTTAISLKEFQKITEP